MPLVEGIPRADSLSGHHRHGQLRRQRGGTLVYVAGAAFAPINVSLSLWIGMATPNRSCQRSATTGGPAFRPTAPALSWRSPKRGPAHVSIIDLKDAAATALTFGEGNNVYPTWSPDGESVIYRSNRREAYGMYRHALDGSGGPQLIYPSTDDLMPGGVSRAGMLVFAAGEQTGRRAILTLPLAGGQASEFLATSALEHMPTFSPDGAWIAYASNESGRSEVYIRCVSGSSGNGQGVAERRDGASLVA